MRRSLKMITYYQSPSRRGKPLSADPPGEMDLMGAVGIIRAARPGAGQPLSARPMKRNDPKRKSPMPYTLSQASAELLPPDENERGVPGGEENRWTLNFGPQHPATHTTLRIVLELDGERIVGVTPHIGYLHSGFEKLMENLNYNQNVTIVDRMDYSAPVYNELAWFHAVEKLMDIELT